MLSRDRINVLVAQAASVLDVPAEVVATTPGGRDTPLVEVILTVATGDDLPSRMLVWLDRNQSETEIRDAVTTSLCTNPNLHC
jgi:hypothetical protein